jgi:Spy/CpxP family protein refolding chaperone
MKHVWVVTLSAILLAAAAFALTRHLVSKSAPDEMTWLREEFRLTPAQADAIEKIHAAYEPICADHCERIGQARRRLHALETNPQANPTELAAAREAWRLLGEECTTATRSHLEAVAAQMSPEQGQRYLALVGPRLTRRDPGQPFGLR